MSGDFWALGDYESVARRLQPLADDLVDTACLVHGSRVLDVAAGTGNVAVAAVSRGARVLACDSSPAMVESGQKRTRGEHLPVEWRVADMQALPLPDHAMDAALSAFGVMFASDPERAAGELFRVVRPGGTIALANWARTGFSAAHAEVVSDFLPPSEGADPLAWGDPDVVRELLGRGARLELWERQAVLEFASVDDACAWFEQQAPYAWGRASLEPARYEDMRARLRATVDEFASGAALELGYLLARVRVR
jgi:SAM-dependent methyltransferase